MFSVLKMDRGAITGLGILGFFMVCVKEDGEPKMASREPKKAPKKMVYGEGVRCSMGGGKMAPWEGQNLENMGQAQKAEDNN